LLDRGRAQGLAVDVEPGVSRGRLDLDPRAAREQHLGMRQVASGVEVWQAAEHLRDRQILDDHQIQGAVVDAGLGGDVHAAAEEAPVGGRGHDHAARVDGLAVQADRHLDVSVPGHRPQRSHQERDSPAQGLGGLVHELVDQAPDARTRDVEEEGLRVFSRAIAIAEAAGVGTAGGTPGQRLDGAVEHPGHAECARQVAAGSQGQQTELDLLAETRGEKSRHHLAHGSVTPGHNDALGAARRSLPRNPLGVARAARVLDRELTEQRLHPLRNGLPAAGRSAASAAGVHDDERGCRHGGSLTRLGPDHAALRSLSDGAIW